MRFEKYSGAKNVFLISKFDPMMPNHDPKWIQRWCDPYKGVYADGVVFVEGIGRQEIRWHFYNSDGSVAEMCGNAIRCVHAYWNQVQCFEAQTLTIHTIAGPIVSHMIDQKSFTVEMNLLTGVEEVDLKKLISGLDPSAPETVPQLKTVFKNAAYSVDTGVPHLVLLTDDLDRAKEEISLIRKLRHHVFFPRGTNVTILQQLTKAETKAVTFERGVEDFTQACGTGAGAAACVQFTLNKQTQIDVLMPGGKLKVEIKKDAFNLTGPAEHIASVELHDPGDLNE